MISNFNTEGIKRNQSAGREIRMPDPSSFSFFVSICSPGYFPSPGLVVAVCWHGWAVVMLMILLLFMSLVGISFPFLPCPWAVWCHLRLSAERFFPPLVFSVSICSLSNTACKKTKRKHTLEVLKNLFDLLRVDGFALLCVGLRRSGCSVVVVVDRDLDIPLGISEKCDGRLLPNEFINKKGKK